MSEWLHEVKLTGRAADYRREMGVSEFKALQRAIEHLALVTERPIQEVAERVLGSVGATLAEEEAPLDGFLSLVEDIIHENER